MDPTLPARVRQQPGRKEAYVLDHLDGWVAILAMTMLCVGLVEVERLEFSDRRGVESSCPRLMEGQLFFWAGLTNKLDPGELFRCAGATSGQLQVSWPAEEMIKTEKK